MNEPSIAERWGEDDETDSAGLPSGTIHAVLAAGAARHPRRTAIVDGTGRLDYAATLAAADRIAAGLAAIGVGPGDVVAVQLPNRREFPLIEYACARLGAVMCPLPPIYRRHELRFMLKLTAPKVVVIPGVFRGFDHRPMLRGLLPCLARLPHVYVVDGEACRGFRPFAGVLGATGGAPSPRVDLYARAEIIFTSGTTGEPKGVMHTHASNYHPLVALIRRQHLAEGEVVLMASTFGHQTGFAYGGQLPVLVGGTLVLMDAWNADRAVELIAGERVTWTMAATPFLQDLVAAAERAGPEKLASLRIFLCSGAPIPRALLARAHDILGCSVVSGWGMTELGLVTLSELDDPLDRVAGTDGHAFAGMEVDVRDDDGNSVPADVEGDLVTRGPNLFRGYYRRLELTLEGFTPDGWFRTGDRARMDADGYIRITGRAKDIVIRGGENIPVVEVEEALHRHPAVLRAAVVAVPDPRLQERACAAVVLREGASLDLEGMRRHLADYGLARPYWPEYLEVCEAFPMTPSGKVRKFLLREDMAQRIEARRTDGASA